MAPVTTKDGFWGPPTALVDWCEENYVITSYIAEFWNTLSNLLIIVPSIVFAIHSRRIGLEDRYFWLQFSFFLVGIGSWLFHMTLLFGMQISDELPMVFGSSLCFYVLCENGEPRGKANLRLATGLAVFTFAITAIYLFVKDPVFFQVSYGVTVVATFARALYNIRNFNSCRQVRFIYFLSVSSYLFAFFLWNVDQHFCSNLRYLRGGLYGLASILSPFTQLHAWWHVIVSLATYQFIAFDCIARQIRLGKKLSWAMALGIFPYVTLETHETHGRSYLNVIGKT